jgi:UDP-N-acetyl-D-glucosamine dehydrogenase
MISFKNNNPVVCVQGLGFVGSAMSTAVAMANNAYGNSIFNVIGVDLDNDTGCKRVKDINEGFFPFETTDSVLVDALKKCVNNGNLKATHDEDCYSIADVVIVDIHLDIPFKDDEPDLNFDGMISAITAIATRIKSGALIIVETTVPPGTCEKIVIPTVNKILKERGMSENSVYIAHSYERVMPGKDYLASIVDFWRVFSGKDNKSGDKCEEFFNKIINVDEYPLTRLTSTTASETAKVLENTYRAVNIALMDEWGKFAEHVGIDLFEVVNAIKMRPTHSNIMRPGFGVGGYCLTKDPSFAPASYRQLFSGKDNKFPISTIASRINYNMPQHVADLIKQSLGGSFLGRNIHILGVSYREDVGDTRFSPAETFAETCIAQGGNVTFSDPYVDYWEELDLLSVNLDKFDSSIDVLVFGTPHSQYKEEGYVSNKVINPKLLVFDTNNVLSKQAIQKFKKLGCELFFIGKG